MGPAGSATRFPVWLDQNTAANYSRPVPQSGRFVLIALSLTFFVAGLYHRIRAAQAGDRRNRRKEDWPILIGMRFGGARDFPSDSLASGVAGRHGYVSSQDPAGCAREERMRSGLLPLPRVAQGGWSLGQGVFERLLIGLIRRILAHSGSQLF